MLAINWSSTMYIRARCTQSTAILRRAFFILVKKQTNKNNEYYTLRDGTRNRHDDHSAFLFPQHMQRYGGLCGVGAKVESAFICETRSWDKSGALTAHRQHSTLRGHTTYLQGQLVPMASTLTRWLVVLVLLVRSRLLLTSVKSWETCFWMLVEDPIQLNMLVE